MTRNRDVVKATHDYFRQVLSKEDNYEVSIPESEQVELSQPSNIPLKKARRTMELYIKGRTIAGIASAIHLTVDEVREVLHIVNIPCKRCDSNKIGDVTLVGNVLPLCRKCRKEIDV